MAESTEKEGVVSVFLGHVPSKQTFDRYLKETYDDDTDIGVTCPLWTDLGVDWFDHDSLETYYEGKGLVLLDTFLTIPFSYLDTFRNQLVSACQRLSVDKLNAGVFLYNFEYPEDREFPSPYLFFVGSFPFTASIPDWLRKLTEGDEAS